MLETSCGSPHYACPEVKQESIKIIFLTKKINLTEQPEGDTRGTLRRDESRCLVLWSHFVCPAGKQFCCCCCFCPCFVPFYQLLHSFSCVRSFWASFFCYNHFIMFFHVFLFIKYTRSGCHIFNH